MKIVIKGPPISKMRPRLGKSIVYDPQSLIKETIRNSMMNQSSLSCFCATNAYSVDFTFYFTPSKSLSKLKRLSKIENREPCLVKNDLDNLEKFYCDCANGILFEDDHQIVEMSSRKLWAEEPRIEMIVRPYQKINQG